MKFNEEQKRNIINNYKGEQSVREYLKSLPISNSTFYKWAKLYGNNQIVSKEKRTNFIDATAILNESVAYIELNVKDVLIKITDEYNEVLLLKVIKSINKL